MEELKAAMAEIAAELKRLSGPVSEELRLRFIEVRSQLFTRGYFDPVLARFDSATKTSDPCRLTTSGSDGRAAAAIAPPGTTQ